ncbi:DUF2793 domain-containing protein [Marinibacterium profundimaris]|uniref:DUF2793 domain-containing protein n=1 Tax=Marinibacterium profundimaris TaxID=1679460 RepID=UPI000B52685D|nr:DUF2793 domain-containing protein [Marinibacterium profundimaris]MAU94916.1 DUF2793 domain-containing protein [Fulvimarina sp.]
MPDTAQSSPVLSLPYIQPSQAQKHVTHNAALAALDTLVQAVAVDRTRTAPPDPATPGAVHIVAPGATGDWAGQDDAIATRDGTGWTFLAPKPGWRVHVLDEGFDVIFDGGEWDSARPDFDNLLGLGIGTSASAGNPLSVAGDATLLTHDGAGHRLKINKASASDTASLLFQTGWSGRAEMGTMQSDDFAIKVSADGSAWTVALRFDAASGAASGAAVQQDPSDTTAGRLARADYAYGPGNLLGQVSDFQGTPTGAVIESGTAGGGRYIRWADGTQICTAELVLSHAGAERLEAYWSFPKDFAGAAEVSLSALLDAGDFAASVSGPGLDAALAPAASAITATGTTIRLYRVAGAADFSSGDSAACRVTAIGRWL